MVKKETEEEDRYYSFLGDRGQEGRRRAARGFKKMDLGFQRGKKRQKMIIRNKINVDEDDLVG